jgi:predicted membrane protein
MVLYALCGPPTISRGDIRSVAFRYSLFSGRAVGRDRIWRLYPHNSPVQNALALGLLGIALTVLLAFQVMRIAYRLDSLYGSWQRTVFAVCLGLIGIGGVVQREVYWIALGSAVWAKISTDKLKTPQMALTPRFGRYAAGRSQTSRDSYAHPSLA